ncbi:MAG: S8 family serine peptidase [Clostridia bacterium]|nr:S8 family serine peptidase [Clostridia bacterium]
MEKVWDFSTGTSDLKVAVLDRGVSSHEDLDDNYDISNACDFYDATLEVPFFCKIDESGHGTHVAGIIGAKGNNNLGVCGINWDVSIVQMRVIGAETIYSFTNALEWAISDDIDIISMSASIYEPIPYAEDAIRDYCNQGGIFVCSTGNDEQDNDSYGQYNYPSYYGSNLYEDKIDNMISVGRVDWNDSRPDDANWGLETINIYAPGQYILSTFPIDICLEGNYGVDTESGDTYWACECEFEYDELSEDEGEWVHVSNHHINGYHFMSGSSMSTPHVSGVAALLLSVNPNLTATQIESCIMNGADTITITTGDGEDQSVKRLNAWGAFKYLMDNYPIYERSIGYDDCTGSYYVDADAPYMKDNTMMIKYNIQNPGSYTFTLSSNSPIEVKLYNSNLEEIVTTQTIVNNGCEIEFTYTLSTSTYYIKTNYINDSVEGTINIEIDCPPHTHEYIGWTYYSPTQHIECCECGQKGTQKGSHIVQEGSVVNYKGICMYCRATVFLLDNHFPDLMSVTRYSINGSYILPNGIIVLVDEDIEAYENGTLVFYDKDNLPQTQ